MTAALNLEDLNTPFKTELFDLSNASDLEADDRLLQCSYAELLASMYRATGGLGCRMVRPTPHELLFSDTSRELACGQRQLAQTHSWGRWRSSLSVQSCGKHARIAKQTERLPPHVRRDLRSHAARSPAVSRVNYALC